MEHRGVRVGLLILGCALPDSFGQSLFRAGIAPVAIRAVEVAVFAEADDRPTTNACRGRIIWRIHQLLEVVFVRAVPDVHFRFKILPAFRTVLPLSGVTFGVVMGAERVVAVVAVTTVPAIGEQHVFVLVVANPLAAALRVGELAPLAAQTATRGVRIPSASFLPGGLSGF